MMKCALVVILSLVCSGFQLNRNLNNEIIQDLRNLSRIVQFSNSSFVPGQYMNNHPSRCLGNFTMELKELLKDVKQDEKTKPLLEKLDANLNSLGRKQTTNSNCTMDKKHITSLNNYIVFLRKLNNGK